MRLQIFDVEHGACALLTCDDSTHILLDCGHNATTFWRPGTYLRSTGIMRIEALIITNYDEDHVSGIDNLFANVYVDSLYRNTTVSTALLRSLKSSDGMGAGIASLAYRIDHTFTGSAPDTSGKLRGLRDTRFFYNSYPAFDDENNLSLVTFFDCHGVGVLFPGDIEAAGWRALLRHQGFVDMLAKTNVLVASHHGRESGWCDELRTYCNPFYVVISDKGYMYDTQETMDRYRSIARGGPFRNEATRSVLTTRCDGRIGFEFDEYGWRAY